MAFCSAATDILSSCELITRRFQKALADESLFVLHRSQWKCLHSTFAQILQHLCQLPRPALRSSLPTTLRVLRETMSEAERCMLGCSASLAGPVKHSWLLDKALKEITSTEVVHDHLARFLWAFSATAMDADPIWQNACTSPLDVLIWTEALLEIWQGEDAERDLSSCRDFLTTMNFEEDKSSSLARFILKKISHRLQELGSTPSEDIPAYLSINSSSFKKSKSLGEGKVYEAKWLGGRFAIKDLFNQDRRLFEQEAAIQARARHPNVLPLVCCAKNVTPLKCSLVMELMQKDLRVLLLERKNAGLSPPFSLCVALDLMLQIAQGIEYLHSIHTIHGDLKSSNVLVNFSKQRVDKSDAFITNLKVCDFGMFEAKRANENYAAIKKVKVCDFEHANESYPAMQKGSTCGGTDRRQYTKEADVRSFSMVCYEILTGEILNDTKSVPMLPSNCPRALSYLIESCWSKTPSEQPSFSQISSVLRYLKFCVLLQHEEGAGLSSCLSQAIGSRMWDFLKVQAQAYREFDGPHALMIPLEMYSCGMMLLAHQDFAAHKVVPCKRHDPAIVDMYFSCQRISRTFHELVADKSVFFLHHSQWKCLANTFTQVLQTLHPFVSQALSASPDSSAIMLRVLEEAMSEAERCMLDCSTSRSRPVKHSWLLDKALKEVASTDVVDVHLAQFLWASSNISDPVWRQAQADLSYVVRLTKALSTIWKGEDAKGDLSSCCEFLTTMNCEEDGKSCSLARFILDKIAHHLQELGSPPSEDLPAYLWINSNSFQKNPDSLGEGSFSKVYEAEWLGGRFAIKDIFDTRRNIFEKEAAIQARVRHANVLPLVCCTETTSSLKYSLVMERMQKNLHTLLLERIEASAGKNPPFSLYVAVDLMLQIAQGMEYLHSIKIMHRDLKSSNVLVSFSGHVFDKSNDKDTAALSTHLKVCDFGVSKANHASEALSTMQVGTLCWRAPEVFEQYQGDHDGTNKGRYTRKADVYSFSMVCYEILTGETPYDSYERLNINVTKSVLAGIRPMLPSSCPRALSCLIERCWSEMPSERPSFSQISSVLRFLKFCVLLQNEDGASLSRYLSQPLPPDFCDSIEDMSQSCSQSEGHHALKIPLEMYRCGMRLQQDFVSKNAVQHRPLFSLSWMQKPWKKPDRNPATSNLVTMKKKVKIHTAMKSNLSMSAPNGEMEKQKLEFCEGSKQDFDLEDLLKASAEHLGRGSIGSSYKVRLHTGEIVVVKRLTERLTMKKKDFESRMQFLGNLKHANLVPFIAYYYSKMATLLLSAYMINGSLSALLHGNKKPNSTPLDWETRVRIAVDVALGIQHLHEQNFEHGNIKSSNILVTRNYAGCVSDYGLMQFVGGASSAAKRMVGYRAPEVTDIRKPTRKTDVHSFGVLLLELLTGRPPFDYSKEGWDLQRWVQSVKRDEKDWHLKVFDPQLTKFQVMEDEMERVLDIALDCVKLSPDERPTMKEVVDRLENYKSQDGLR